MVQQRSIPFPQTIRNRDLARRRAYATHLAWYEGRQWPAPAPRDRRQMTLNYLATIVERTAALVLKDRLTLIDSDGLTSDKARRAEAAWTNVHQDNQLDALDLETEIDAAILGDGCYKVTWHENRVRITAIDPQGLHAWWKPDDHTILLQIAHQYQVDPAWAQETYGFKSSGRTTTITERWTRDTWDLWIDNAPRQSIPNPYPWIPYVLFPNTRAPKSPWGTSDLPRLRDVTEELNRTLSTLSNIMELSGNPIAVLENVEASEDVAIRPGAIWHLPTDARAYLLDLLARGGVRIQLEYLDRLYRAMHDLAEVPRSAFGDIGRQISGVAMELDLGPLIQRVQRKRLTRTPVYAQRARMALELLAANGQIEHLDYRPRVFWGAITPQDRTRLVQEEQVLVTQGVHSRRRAANMTGVEDPEAEYTQWLTEEQQQAAITPGGRTNGRRPEPNP